MKTYIGTKTVKAEPMVLGVYKKPQGKILIPVKTNRIICLDI